jgi:hypothetical protein
MFCTLVGIIIDPPCRGLPGGNVLSLLRQRKYAKKGDPGSSFLSRQDRDKNPLRYSRAKAAAELVGRTGVACVATWGAVLLKQSSPTAPSPAPLLGDSQREFQGLLFFGFL